MEQSIKSTLDSVRSASISSNDKLYNKQTQLQELYNKKKKIEDARTIFVLFLIELCDDVFFGNQIRLRALAQKQGAMLMTKAAQEAEKLGN